MNLYNNTILKTGENDMTRRDNAISGDYDPKTDSLTDVHCKGEKKEFGNMTADEYLDLCIKEGRTELSETKKSDGTSHFSAYSKK